MLSGMRPALAIGSSSRGNTHARQDAASLPKANERLEIIVTSRTWKVGAGVTSLVLGVLVTSAMAVVTAGAASAETMPHNIPSAMSTDAKGILRELSRNSPHRACDNGRHSMGCKPCSREAQLHTRGC